MDSELFWAQLCRKTDVLDNGAIEGERRHAYPVLLPSCTGHFPADGVFHILREKLGSDDHRLK